MRVKVLLEITAADGSVGSAAEVAVFEKQTERPEDLGLSIAEGKATGCRDIPIATCRGDPVGPESSGSHSN